VGFVLNQQFIWTNNTNYGGRIIIPDANMQESNLAAYLKYISRSGKWIVEGGAGLAQKYIRTFETRTLNAPGEPIRPFSRNSMLGNGMIGFVYKPSRFSSIKQNNAKGFRTPNLGELSSNGLHEGVYRYEIGDPNMKVEQNVNSDITFEWDRSNLFFSLSAYHNYFINYIYLAPTQGDSFFHFPVYRFRQKNARITGGECFITYKPGFIKNLQLKESITITRGRLGSGDYLPFIPAYKTATACRWEKTSRAKRRTIFMEPEFVYIFPQNSPALFETSTSAYYLLNFTAGISLSKPGEKQKLRVSLNVTNISLYNQGRNIILALRKQF
jgi:iron complex outermembrane recepter protein